jgi:hypothetical protein
MFPVRLFIRKYILGETILPPALFNNISGTSELKVQFGAGKYKLEGWNNHDAEVNICQTLPYKADSVSFILAEHVVEHVVPPDALRFLDECHRVLKPGGTLRVCVPVIVGNNPPLSLEHARNLVLEYGHLAVYSDATIIKLLELAGFSKVTKTGRKPVDSHHLCIGDEKDDQETCRVEAVK